MPCVDVNGRPTACAAPLSPNDLAQLFFKAGFRGSDLENMVAVTLQESSGIPNAVNPSSGAMGLVQINPSAHPNVDRAHALDPQWAADYAYQLYQGRISREGFGARFNDWEAWTSGAYAKFTGQAKAAVASLGGLSLGNPFGLRNVTSVIHPAGLAHWLGLDRGIVPTATTEVNWLLPAGSQQPVQLPTGSWTLTGSGTMADGRFWQRWEDPATGMVIGLLHLSKNTYSGTQNVPGGTPVAISGWPNDPQYGVGGSTGPGNAHLAVIMNKAAADLFDPLGSSGNGSGGGSGPGISGSTPVLGGLGNAAGGAGNAVGQFFQNVTDVPGAVQAATGSVINAAESGLRRAGFVVIGLTLLILGIILLIEATPGGRAATKRAAETAAEA